MKPLAVSVHLFASLFVGMQGLVALAQAPIERRVPETTLKVQTRLVGLALALSSWAEPDVVAGVSAWATPPPPVFVFDAVVSGVSGATTMPLLPAVSWQGLPTGARAVSGNWLVDPAWGPVSKVQMLLETTGF